MQGGGNTAFEGGGGGGGPQDGKTESLAWLLAVGGRGIGFVAGLAFAGGFVGGFASQQGMYIAMGSLPNRNTRKKERERERERERNTKYIKDRSASAQHHNQGKQVHRVLDTAVHRDAHLRPCHAGFWPGFGCCSWASWMALTDLHAADKGSTVRKCHSSLFVASGPLARQLFATFLYAAGGIVRAITFTCRLRQVFHNGKLTMEAQNGMHSWLGARLHTF